MERDTPFRLQFPRFKNSFFSRIFQRSFLFPFEKILGLVEIDDKYRELQECEDEVDFFTKVVRVLDIKLQYQEESLSRIPKKGALVVLSNHPFGTIEAVATASVLLSVRGDLRILGNYMLNKMPEIREYIIPVDPFDRKSSVSSNIAPIRSSIDWLKNGGMLLAYPSGAVSHFHLNKMEIIDPEWHSSIARIIRKTEATVVPLFVEGHNSYMFQILGLIHPLLRTIQIPRENE